MMADEDDEEEKKKEELNTHSRHHPIGRLCMLNPYKIHAIAVHDYSKSARAISAIGGKQEKTRFSFSDFGQC